MSHRTRSIRQLAVTAVALVALLTGCSSTAAGGLDTAASSAAQQSDVSQPSDAARPSDIAEQSNAAPASDASQPATDLSGTLTVFAAASLKATFDQLRTTFMEQNPNVDFPEITYDGSSTLVTQIKDGAPADVFASADENNMDKVADLVTDRVDFATNTLQIAVSPGNPKHIASLADIAKPGIITVICAAEVPCGTASHKALDAAGVSLKPASEEQNVTAVLTKVETGNADAGLVYATDVNSSNGKVEGVDFPEAAKAVNTYPIAALSDSKNSDAAKAFIDLVTSAAGQKVLSGVGFGTP